MPSRLIPIESMIIPRAKPKNPPLNGVSLREKIVVIIKRKLGIVSKTVNISAFIWRTKLAKKIPINNKLCTFIFYIRK